MNAPATYTVDAVNGEPRQWNSANGGPMLDYRIDLKDAAGEVVKGVSWSRKPASPAPTVGQQVTGTIDHSGQFGPKFRAAQQGGFGGGGGGGGGFRPRDPAERRSIQMQHAQKCAVDALRLAAEHGDYKPPNAADVVDHVKRLAQAMFDQVEGVAKA